MECSTGAAAPSTSFARDAILTIARTFPMTETSPSPGLERRLDVAVPLRDIDGEVQKRIANLANL